MLVVVLLACTGGEVDPGDIDSQVVALTGQNLTDDVLGSSGDGFQSGIELSRRKVVDDLGLVADFLFSGGGPTDFFLRLQEVDLRVGGLVERSESTQRSCVLDDTVELSPSGTLPGGDTFPLTLQCRESVDPGYEVVVGNTSDGALHLAEFNHGDPASPSVVFAKASPGGPTEMYLASIDPGVGALAEAGFLLHLRADSGTTPPNMELTLGGQSPYAKVSCGVQLRSNGTVIYAEGSFMDTHDGTGAETPCEEPIAFCADAVDLTEVLLAECVDAGIYGFELTTLSSETVDMAQVRSLATTVIGDGLTAFDDLAQVE